MSRRQSLHFFALASIVAAPWLCGCEGYDRKHDYKVVDVTPPDPTEMDTPAGGARASTGHIPDIVEEMMARRAAYLQQLVELERAFLAGGDAVRANWARRQRNLTDKVEVYPYLTQETPEQTAVRVEPKDAIPAADAAYNDALKIRKEVGLIPLAGALPHVKDKARQALEMFKRVIHEYPTSDKVDDCAFYIAEIYKEYLREDDPDDELAIRYYRWALALDPNTPHPVRFQLAVVLDFRRHDRSNSLPLYHQVIELQEDGNVSNQKFAATRIEQLSDEDFSHIRAQEPRARTVAAEARRDTAAPREELPVPPNESSEPPSNSGGGQ